MCAVAASVAAVAPLACEDSGEQQSRNTSEASTEAFCAELQRAADAFQGPTPSWSSRAFQASAEGQPAPVRRAVKSLAEVVDGSQRFFADLESDAGPKTSVAPGVFGTEFNLLAWTQSDECDSTTLGQGSLFDPELNPSRLTVAAVLTKDGRPPPLIAVAPYELGFGSSATTVESAEDAAAAQQAASPLILYSDVDRRCFALGPYGWPEHQTTSQGTAPKGDDDAASLAATADAATRKSCIPSTGADDGTLWSDSFDGWTVQIVDSDTEPASEPTAHSWQITQTRWAIATPPPA